MMKYFLILFICATVLADTAFNTAVSTRVEELRQATGSLACPTYKQECLSGTATANFLCDQSACGEFVLDVFAGQGNCDYNTRCNNESAFRAGCQSCLQDYLDELFGGTPSEQQEALTQCYTDHEAATITGVTHDCQSTNNSTYTWACGCGTSTCRADCTP